MNIMTKHLAIACLVELTCTLVDRVLWNVTRHTQPADLLFFFLTGHRTQLMRSPACSSLPTELRALDISLETFKYKLKTFSFAVSLSHGRVVHALLHDRWPCLRCRRAPRALTHYTNCRLLITSTFKVAPVQNFICATSQFLREALLRQPALLTVLYKLST